VLPPGAAAGWLRLDKLRVGSLVASLEGWTPDQPEALRLGDVAETTVAARPTIVTPAISMDFQRLFLASRLRFGLVR
jgi:hypothetical protein